MPKINVSTFFFAIASFCLITAVLIYFDSIIKPFVIAFFIWFIINQVQSLFSRIRIKGKPLHPAISGSLALSLILGILILTVELLIRNIEMIRENVPEYVSNIKLLFEQANTLFSDPRLSRYTQDGLESIDFAGFAESMISSFSGWLGSIAVIIVYIIFFLFERNIFRDKLKMIYPEKSDDFDRFSGNLERINHSIRSYFWSKSVISFVTGLISYIILWMMDVDFAFLWSFLIFVMNFIPYIGPLISSILPAIFALLVSGDFMKMVYVFAAMEGVQIVLGNFVEPKVMGKGTNLSPLVVILALAFWGMIWGIPGMLLAVPMASLAVITFSQIPSARFLAILMSEKGSID